MNWKLVEFSKAVTKDVSKEHKLQQHLNSVIHTRNISDADLKWQFGFCENTAFLAIFAIQTSLQYDFVHNLVLCYYKFILYNILT